MEVTIKENPGALTPGLKRRTVSLCGANYDYSPAPVNGIATAPVLRDDQRRFICDLDAAFAQGARRVLGVAPTGCGKTVAFSHMVAHAARNGARVLILGHRQEIVAQISAALDRNGVAHGLIVAGATDPVDRVCVASIQTLAMRLGRFAGAFDLVVVDEAHHAVSDSWSRVLAAFPRARILGVTATPERLDGRGLADVFDHMVVGPSVAELIAAGFLSPFTIFAPTKVPDLSGVRTRAGDFAIEDLRERMGGVVIKAAVAEYLRIAPGRPAIAFCVDIDHSRALADAFCRAGVRAMHVDGETPARDRRAAVAALGRGGLDVISNVALFGEGVDVPDVAAAILLRPTQSVGLFLQQVGRALRPAPGKDRALILDFAGNTIRHGLPDEPRDWSLESKPRRERPRGPAMGLRRCGDCGALNQRDAQSCGHCGADLRTPLERMEVNIRLAHATAAEQRAKIRAMNYSQRLNWAGASEDRLHEVAAACGYKKGWVFHVLSERRGAA